MRSITISEASGSAWRCRIDDLDPSFPSVDKKIHHSFGESPCVFRRIRRMDGIESNHDDLVSWPLADFARSKRCGEGGKGLRVLLCVRYFASVDFLVGILLIHRRL